jgi:hypothetical protein
MEEEREEKGEEGGGVSGREGGVSERGVGVGE